MSAELASREVSTDEHPVLVMGATGYVGSRLVPRLLHAGHRVRASSRSLEKLEARAWSESDRAELVVAEATDVDSLREAMTGCRAVYYLVHSMERGTRDFEARDRAAAEAVAEAARDCGVSRILYLGGLGEPSPGLSEHLRSRHEVARLLGETGVPVTHLRAAMIIGSGSGSFEILRYLTEHLPVMIAPRWLRTPVQPIAIRNVLTYLVEALSAESTTGETFDIGGPDVTTYRELIAVYAEEADLRERRIVNVPFLTPKLSAYWIDHVTPAPASLARPLAEGLRNPVVCKETRIRDIIPQELLGAREAIKLAIAAEQLGRVESHWSDAGPLPPSAWAAEGDAAWTGGEVLKDERSRVLHVPALKAWAPIARIGGRTGYYHGDWLWGARGVLDKLAGGFGLGRGRASGERHTGDALDFWRVAAIEPGHRLRLVTEMKMPGRGVLEWTIDDAGSGRTRITQRAAFMPRGLAGLAYWWLLYPIHATLFRGMLDGLAREARGA